jgi:DNA repair exonuclease SbcCD ATPase subunit
MITLKTLQWDNCFSYGAANSIDLSENNLTQLIGKNGAGKSSIPLILEEVLFNKNSKNIKKADIQNREYNKGYNISLDFSVDNDNYKIDVKRSRGTIKVKLTKNDIDISSHTATNTYKTLESILKLDFKTFSQLVYQNTGASLQFLTATDGNRKKFLTDLFGIDEYEKYHDIFKNVSKDISNNVIRLKAEVDKIQSWLSTNNISSTITQPMLDLPKISETDEQHLRDLRRNLEYISQNNKKIRENNTYKNLLSNISVSDFSLVGEEEKGIQSYDGLLSEIGSNEREIKEAAKEIAHLSSLDKECPTCQQKVNQALITDLINKNKERSKEAENIVKSINAKVNSIKSVNSSINKKKAKQKEFEELLSRYDSTLPIEVLDADKISLEIEEITKKINALNAEIEQVNSENEKRRVHNTKISIFLEQSEKLKSELETAADSLSLEEKKLSNLEILKRAFSTNGLLAYKLENLVKELEDLTNTYLAELSDGRFGLAFVVEKDKLNVSLSDNGSSVDILALSSGELARVNTATLLSIRKLMSSISKSRLNVLFLDEVINVIDELGREKLVEVLLSEEDLNTYMVSHGWTHPLLDKIEVIKQKNISRLEK